MSRYQKEQDSTLFHVVIYDGGIRWIAVVHEFSSHRAYPGRPIVDILLDGLWKAAGIFSENGDIIHLRDLKGAYSLHSRIADTLAWEIRDRLAERRHARRMEEELAREEREAEESRRREVEKRRQREEDERRQREVKEREVAERDAAEAMSRTSNDPESNEGLGNTLLVSEVASIMRTTPSSVRRWIRKGNLRAVIKGGRYLIARSALEKFRLRAEAIERARKRAAGEIDSDGESVTQFRVGQVAKLLNMSTSAVRSRIKDGQLIATRRAKGHYRIARTALDDYLGASSKVELPDDNEVVTVKLSKEDTIVSVGFSFHGWRWDIVMDRSPETLKKTDGIAPLTFQYEGKTVARGWWIPETKIVNVESVQEGEHESRLEGVVSVVTAELTALYASEFIDEFERSLDGD